MFCFQSPAARQWWTEARVGGDIEQVLAALGQHPPEDLDDASLQEIWSWGMQHWHIEALAGRTRVTVDSSAMAEGKNGLL